ncbi:MFS transporter [Virgisporangium aliadipatigenens]|uniref:MFS transporter n=1 Tax=Virgisporangium aliadipatigenens TaxID=741659 RepID=A0A8J3YI12_9ACTN|nr:MFS transporter [Virgisporangium aliadipatigenens]GIJ45604.1 MFS transporter [Virgisporangium aliadipatigenens]
MSVPVAGYTVPAGPPEPSTRRERVGWYWYDWANSAFYTTVITVFLGPYLTAIAKTAAGCVDDDPCKDATVPFFGIDVAPGSVYPYATVVSVIVTVLVLPVMGAIADRSAHKRWLMGGGAYLGAACTIGFLFLTGDRYMLGAVLFLLANIFYGCSVVVYNSYLPQIAGPDQRDSVSSVGWAFGYLGGGLLLLFNVVAVLFKDDLGMSTGEVARYSLASAGVWWAAFTTVSVALLRDRPPVDGVVSGGVGRVLSAGFTQLWHTFRSLRAYPLTLAFLVSFLIFNDGIQTVIGLSSVYAAEELDLPDDVLIPTILMVQFLAFFGALGLGAMAKRIGAMKTLIVSLVLWTVIVLVAYVLPAGVAWAFIAMGAAIGIVLGGSQALARSLFSQLIPAGKEGEYFGLYEISSRGTSWMGPLLFGLAYDLTRSYRVAIISLLVFFLVGTVCVALVPMRRAITAAGNVPPEKL